MLTNKNFRAVLLGCAAVALLGACSGADGVASPGVGAFVPPPAAPPPPPPPPPAPPPPTGGPAASCPTGFANVGVISDLRNCQLPSTITGNLVVPKVEGTIYSVSGRTQVGTDAGNNPLSPIPGSQQGILTIEPGVRIFGNSGGDYLLVNRGSQIFAEGTATDPIILTSRQSILGETNENSIGQWGGFIINGRAPITDGCPAGVTPPSASCEAQVEGSNAFYGGNSPSITAAVSAICASSTPASKLHRITSSTASLWRVSAAEPCSNMFRFTTALTTASKSLAEP